MDGLMDGQTKRGYIGMGAWMDGEVDGDTERGYRGRDGCWLDR